MKDQPGPPRRRRTDPPPSGPTPAPARSGARRHRGQTDATHVRLALTVNGERREVLFDASKTLLEVLREDLDLTGTKHGCELGECGACAVLLDGQPVLSCLVLGAACEGADVETIEGVAGGPDLHPVQARLADHGGAQCGYCTPGIVLTAKHLLETHARPTRDEITEALSGNLCRCTGYLQIVEAIELAAADLREAAPEGGRTGARANRRERGS